MIIVVSDNKINIISIIIIIILIIITITIMCMALRYQITTNLSSRVAGLNPSWNDPKPDPQVSYTCSTVFVSSVTVYYSGQEMLS